jgi:hypothetical protein
MYCHVETEYVHCQRRLLWLHMNDAKLLTCLHTRNESINNYFLYHILVILVCLIFFCSWKMPYIRASDVGGPEERQQRSLHVRSYRHSHPGT